MRKLNKLLLFALVLCGSISVSVASERAETASRFSVKTKKKANKVLGVNGTQAVGFTAKRLVVNRVGTGSASLSSAATAVFLDEYQFGGTAGISFTVPTSTSGSVNQLTQSGSAGSEGGITQSQDGRFVAIEGYDATTGTSGIASSTVARVAAYVDANQNFVTAPFTAASGYSGNNIRSAATRDGSALYTGGTGSPIGGVRYITSSSSSVSAGTAVAICTSATQNLRIVKIINNTLYFSSGAAGGYGVNQVGTAGTLPTSNNTSVTAITGTTFNATASSSPYGFIILDKSTSVIGPDVLYVVEDNANLSKFSFDGTTWTYRNKVTIPTGLVGLAGYVDASNNVQLFMSGPSGIYTFGDNSAIASNIAISTGSATTAIATPGTNKAFRGIAFSPGTGQFGTITSSVSGLAAVTGLASAAQSFTFNGTGHVGPVTLTSSSSDFEISTSATSGFGQSISIAPDASGNFSGTTVYVRLASTATAGATKSTNISFFSANGTSPNSGVSVTGSVVNAALTLNPSAGTTLTLTPSYKGTASAPSSVTVDGSVYPNTSVAVSSGFVISTDGGSTFGTSGTLTPASDVTLSGTIQVKTSGSNSVGTQTGTITFSGGGLASNVVLNISALIQQPTISTVANLNTFATSQGAASASQTFTFSAVGVNGDVTVDASGTNFEVSLDDNTYSNSFTVSPVSQNISSTTVYVRLKSSAGSGSSTSNITLSGGNANTQTVPATWTITGPSTATTKTTITGLDANLGSASAVQSFGVSGSALTNSISIASTGTNASYFEVSLDGVTFTNSVSLSVPANQIISTTPVFVRASANAPAGLNTGNIQITSSPATTINITVSGTVTPPTVSASQASLTGFTNYFGFASPTQQFSVSGVALNGNLTIKSNGSPANAFEVSLDGSNFASQQTLSPTSGSVSATTVYVRQSAAATIGTTTGNILVSATDATDVNVGLSGTVNAPTVSVSPSTLSSFAAVYQSASSSQQLTVSGAGITTNVQVSSTGTPSTAFEFSTDGSTYSNSVQISPNGSGTVTSTTVYVRASASNTIGTTTGTISVSSANASTKTVSASVTVLGPTITFNPTLLNNFKSVSGAVSSIQGVTISGVRLVADITVSASAKYEISADSSTFSNSPVTISQTAGSASQRIYLRLKQGNAKGFTFDSLTATTTQGTGKLYLYGQVTQPFSSNSLVVLRVGDGVNTLVNSGNALFLDEYSLNKVLIQTIPLPFKKQGKNKGIVLSGVATSEGLMTRSGDGKYFSLVGYDTTGYYATNGTKLTSSLSSTTTAAVGRTVAVIDYDGYVDVTTAPSNFSSGNNPRSAFTTNGTDIWLCGGAGGVVYTAKGNTGTATTVSTTVTNLRSLGYAELGGRGQLLVSTASGTAVRLGTVGTGTPTTSGNTITNLNGIPVTLTPYQFLFLDQSTAVAGMDVVYITGDPGGIMKYSLVGTTWTSNGAYDASSSYRGISGFVKNSAGQVQLIVSTDNNSGTTALNILTDTKGYNQPITITSTPAFQTLVSTTTKQKYTSVVYAPVNENCGSISVWKGSGGSAWDYSPNWCGGIPTATDTVVIPTGTVYQPTLPTGTSVTVKSLNIQGTFNLATGSSIAITGNYSNTGTFNAATGSTITFNGTSAQTLSGSGTNNFYNLVISNTGSGRVTNLSGSTVQVSNTLSLPSGGKYTNAGSTILVSNATGTGRLGVLTNAGDYAGTLTVQRYLPKTLVGSTQVGTNVMVGSPVSGVKLSDFQTSNSQMFGFPGATGPGGRPNYSSVYLYNNDSTGAPNQGWVKPTSITKSMEPGTAARIFYSGQFFVPSPVSTPIYSLTGTLPSSLTYPLTLTRCNAAACTTASFPSGNGWNLVANPVPSEIDWSSSSWTGRSNIASTYYIWQQNQKRYATYTYDPAVGSTSKDSTNGLSRFIPSGQAFFVKANVAGTLTVTEACKRTASAPFAGFNRLAANYRVLVTATSPLAYVNEAIVSFRSGAFETFNDQEDAQLLPGNAVNLATITNAADYLVVNRLPIPTANTRLRMFFNTAEKGQHTLKFDGLADLIADGYTISLVDNFTGNTTVLTDGFVYNFAVTTAANSQGAYRFELLFAPQNVAGLANSKLATLTIAPNPANNGEATIQLGGFAGNTAQISIQDVLGRVVANQEIILNGGSANETIKANLKAGVYTVVSRSEGKTVTTKMVIN